MTDKVTIEKVRAASTSWLASDRLRREIHLARYLPGDRLPPQRRLASDLGISLVTLREALRILEAEGYLELRRGATGGAVVQASSEPVEVLQERLRARVAEFEEWIEFREAVEAAAARLAAQRATENEIAAMADSIASLGGDANAQQFRAADSAFHLGLAGAAGNQVIRQGVEDARAALFLTFDAVPHVVKLTSTADGHERVLAAVRARDSLAAEAAMAAHIREAWREIRAIIEGGAAR